MKLILSSIFNLFIIYGLAQAKLDTNWLIKNHLFRLVLESNEKTEDSLNTKLSLFQDNKEILSDSIICARLYIELKDINSDGYNDLLVYQHSGARANETFNLYLYQQATSKFKKVWGYNEWPNVFKTKYKRLLSACILTGTVGYKFFEITNTAELIDLNVSITDYNLDGKAYDEGCKKARKILKMKR